MFHSDKRRVMIQGKRYLIGEHAIERYWARLRPGLGAELGALEDLKRVLEVAEIVAQPPTWAKDPSGRAYVMVGDDVCFPVGSGRVLTTCLIRHAMNRRDTERLRRQRQIKRGRKGPIEQNILGKVRKREGAAFKANRDALDWDE